jgi:hypothetical protein
MTKIGYRLIKIIKQFLNVDLDSAYLPNISVIHISIRRNNWWYNVHLQCAPTKTRNVVLSRVILAVIKSVSNMSKLECSVCPHYTYRTPHTIQPATKPPFLIPMINEL